MSDLKKQHWKAMFYATVHESLSKDTCANVSDLNDKWDSMFMNATDTKDLGKSIMHIRRQENKKDSEENDI